MSLDSLCSTCDICTFMPKQKYQRVLIQPSLTVSSAPSRILVIDDEVGRPFDLGHLVANKLLGALPFDYTKTIRCHYEKSEITAEEEMEAGKRCSVWTRNVAGNYSIYLCTMLALRQLGTGLDRRPGDAFVNPRLGLVLCIEPLALTKSATQTEYTTKIQRLLKKAGIK